MTALHLMSVLYDLAALSHTVLHVLHILHNLHNLTVIPVPACSLVQRLRDLTVLNS